MHHNNRQKNLGWYFWGVLFISFIGLFPTLCCAQAVEGTTLHASAESAFFTPSSNDQSIIYLGELFGSIPPVLAGTGSGLMAGLFKIFNTSVLTLGIMFAGYTTFVGILNTAGEGEMLGKGWSSIWVPVRTVAGIGLLIPTGSGYCVCQVVMMWLLVQGIGAADTLTSSIIDYMEKGEKIFVAGQGAATSEGNNPPTTTYDSTVTAIYQGLSCMQAYQKEYPLANPNGYVIPPSPTSDTAGTIPVNSPTDANPIYYVFNGYYAPDPAKPDVGKPISCGYLKIANGSSSEQRFASYQMQGMAAILPSLNAAAYYMVNSTAGSTTTTAEDGTSTTTPPVEDKVMEDTYNFVGSDFMVQVVNTYNSYITQAHNAQSGDDGDNHSYYENIRDYGWAALGDLYWDMAKSHGSRYSGTDGQLPWPTDAPSVAVTKSSAGTYGTGCDPNVYDSTVCQYGYTWAAQFVADLAKSRSTGKGEAFQNAGDEGAATTATNLMAAITIGTLNSMFSVLSDGRNPMVAAQSIGHDISIYIEVTLTALALTMTGVAIWAGVSSSVSSAYLVFQTVMAMALPVVFGFCALILVLAGTLSVVIPFIPALAYFLAIIAWLIATLETIIAAPIVAIGVIHPEGHQVWGKAEPAMMLMVNMFLRPSLIVLGLAAGVILSFISVQFVNFGFEQAMHKVLGQDTGDAPSSVEATLYLTTYVALVLACVNKSFSTVDTLPDTVMRWVQGGEGARFGGGGDAAQKIQGAQESAGQKAGDGAAHTAQEQGGAGDKGMGAEDKRAEMQENREKNIQDGNVTTSTGRSSPAATADAKSDAKQSIINGKKTGFD